MEFLKVISLSVAVGVGILLAFMWYPIIGLAIPFSAISYIFLEPKDFGHFEAGSVDATWEPMAA